MGGRGEEKSLEVIRGIRNTPTPTLFILLHWLAATTRALSPNRLCRDTLAVAMHEKHYVLAGRLDNVQGSPNAINPYMHARLLSSITPLRKIPYSYMLTFRNQPWK